MQITSPKSGAKVVAGTRLNFTGAATDAEDGSLTAGITWISNLHGEIGHGGSFSTSGLKVGAHTITALVNDSRGGATASTSVKVTIVPKMKMVARAFKSGAKQYSALRWSQATSSAVDLYRNDKIFRRVKTRAIGSFSDGPVSGSLRSVTYKVCVYGNSGMCSNQVTVRWR